MHSFGQPLNGAARDMLPFFQAMAERPLRLLDIRTAEPITFGEAAVAELARCHRLRELLIAAVSASYMDWTDPALFTSFSSIYLSRLHTITLHYLKLSAESVTAIAAATPQLQSLQLLSVKPSCHPAVIYVIIGAYCEEIETVRVSDWDQHMDA